MADFEYFLCNTGMQESILLLLRRLIIVVLYIS